MAFSSRGGALFEFGRRLLLLNSIVLCSGLALAQGANPQDSGTSNQTSPKAEQWSEKDPETIFPHPEMSRWWLSGQVNLIGQGHGDFRTLYGGPNSLKATREISGSRIFTLYTAARLNHSSDVVFDLEEANGNGISNSLGLAGYTNIDVVR